MVPVPAGWRVRPANGLRIARHGEVLFGGSPLRMVTLSPRGAQLIRAWWAGEPVGADRAERLLARRLLDAGLADPDPPPRPHPADEVTIIVPVYGQPERLRACLEPLSGGWPLIVVDDGSRDAGAIAAMVARRDALGDGFDEQLELGEDVDLVWRLHDAGWQVRYDPAATVAHEHRVDPVAWYRRRVAYNESVAPLHRRHPGRVPVMFLAPAAALAWRAALGGSPWSLLALTIVRAARMRRALAGRIPGAARWAMRVSARGTAREGRELGRALAGPWSPFALGGAARAEAAADAGGAPVSTGIALAEGSPRSSAPASCPTGYRNALGSTR